MEVHSLVIASGDPDRETSSRKEKRLVSLAAKEPFGVREGMRFAYLSILMLWAAPSFADWKAALPGWQYEFPRDHGPHAGFKTEWWYFTGNLSGPEGAEFGYQLTFFRQGILSGNEDVIPLSRFVTRDLKFAHFALSDLGTGTFRYFQKFSRGAFDEAGFGISGRVAWMEGWECELTGDGAFRLRATDDKVGIDLRLHPSKPFVAHGADGVSPKGPEAGQASHYYSFTRMETEGVVRVDGKEVPVRGQSWFDHEWATNQLGKNQIGWDWFSLQFDDGTELMLFQLRLRGGGRDAFSSGTFIAKDGKTSPIANAEFTLEPLDWWTSPHSTARYPVRWRVSVPKIGIDVVVEAALQDQELVLEPVSYWEGAVRAAGKSHSVDVKARGYLEMTGYAGEIVGLK